MAHTAPQGPPTILHTALHYTTHCSRIYSTPYYTALVTLHTSLLHIVYCSVYTAHTTLHTECTMHSRDCSAAQLGVQCSTVGSAVQQNVEFSASECRVQWLAAHCRVQWLGAQCTFRQPSCLGETLAAPLPGAAHTCRLTIVSSSSTVQGAVCSIQCAHFLSLCTLLSSLWLLCRVKTGLLTPFYFIVVLGKEYMVNLSKYGSQSPDALVLVKKELLLYTLNSTFLAAKLDMKLSNCLLIQKCFSFLSFNLRAL